MPIEAPNNSDFPVVERINEPPIAVINNDLPIVSTNAICESPIVAVKLTPIESTCEENNSKFHSESHLSGSSIMFGHIYQGSFFGDTQDFTDSPFCSLPTALENVFTDKTNALFILDGYMVSIMYDPVFGYYLFDSHAKNSLGMPDMSGKAVLLNLRNLLSLQHYLQLLATALNATFFEIVSVTFHALNWSEPQEFTSNVSLRKGKHSANNQRKQYLKHEKLQELVANQSKSEIESKKRKQAKKPASKTGSEREEQLAKRRQNVKQMKRIMKEKSDLPNGGKKTPEKGQMKQNLKGKSNLQKSSEMQQYSEQMKRTMKEKSDLPNSGRMKPRKVQMKQKLKGRSDFKCADCKHIQSDIREVINQVT